MRFFSTQSKYLPAMALCMTLLLTGCAIQEPKPVTTKYLNNARPSEILDREKTQLPPGPPPFSETYAPVSRNLVKEPKLFSLVFDQVSLGIAVSAVVSESELNLAVDSDVDLSRLVTVRLKNVTMEEALDMIVEKGAGYAWKVHDGTLHVRRFKEHIYQMDYLDMVGETDIDVGGDMLASGVQGSGVKGKYQVTGKREAKNTNVWGGITTALEGIKSSDGILRIDPNAGIIYMADTPAKIETMVRILDSLSEALHRQVFIEARILEVTLSDDNRYGLDWSKMAVGFTAAGGGDIARNLPDVLDITINSGSRLFLSSQSQFISVLDFLKTQGDVSVISNPHISVMNNQSAVLTVGYQFPYGDIESVDRNQETGVLTIGATIKRAILGLQLGITPQISKDGIVTLHIVPTITRIQGTERVEIPTGATSVQNISNPIIDLRELATTVRVREGNTVVLAGLISQIRQLNEEGLPLLSSIPYIKNFFRHMQNLHENRELVMFITPYIKNIGPKAGG
jgi:MSHA type pilus biogenesis protein MshL